MVLDKKDNCTSCGICATVCPKKCLGMKLNAEGFYRPYIVDLNACNNCGLCDSVCVKDVNVKNVENTSSYSCVTKDEYTLKSTSSGGLCYELAKKAIEEGKKVCACVYDYDEHIAKHVIVDNVSGLELTKGSKYFQSYTVSGFEKLFDGSEYIVFGTPCQISAIRNVIKKKKIEDNFLLVDFFCHGTPSMNLWKKYLTENGNKDVKSIRFRSKEFGWGKWSLKFEYKDGSIKNDFPNNMFYNFFFGNNCLNDSCYDCKHKMFKSSADIRVGDFWGKKYSSNNNGVSACITITSKGKNAILSIEDRVTLIEENILDTVDGQMHVSPQKQRIRKSLLRALKGRRSLKTINATTMLPYRIKAKAKSLLRRGK